MESDEAELATALDGSRSCSWLGCPERSLQPPTAGPAQPLLLPTSSQARHRAVLAPSPPAQPPPLQLQQSLLCTRVRRGFARCFSAGCPAGPAEPARRAAARRPGRQDSEKAGGVVEPGVGPSVIVARPHPPRPISGLHPPIKPRPGLAPPACHSWVSGIRSISLRCRAIFEALGIAERDAHARIA